MNHGDTHLRSTACCSVDRQSEAERRVWAWVSPERVVKSKDKLKNCTGWMIPSVKKMRICTYLVK